MPNVDADVFEKRSTETENENVCTSLSENSYETNSFSFLRQNPSYWNLESSKVVLIKCVNSFIDL